MTTPPNVRFYRDKHGDWRWKVVARNGRILADSAEGYRNKADCEAGYQMTKRETPYPANKFIKKGKNA